MVIAMRNEGNSKISVPQINLPKGGGAIKGLGETFQPNSFNGTGNLQIPIYTSPCRDFEPKLSLDYGSVSGNGPFGLGLSLSIPSVLRKTEKKLPRYDESDTFILTNSEDLVEMGRKSSEDGKYDIIIYRPRIEGLFANIEYWKNADENYWKITGDSFWKVTAKGNITSYYGKSESGRICDPDDASRVFQWLIEETTDPKGNKIKYKYKAENNDCLSDNECEKNRSRTTNKYIQSILYGNWFDMDQNELWAFEVIFDYGEYDIGMEHTARKGWDPYQPVQAWQSRQDVFSTYKRGFEIRTHRLCRNILMFHHIPELGSMACLVHATSLEYDESPVLTQLKAVHAIGFKRMPDGSYRSKAVPPLEFEYSPFNPDKQTFGTISVENGSYLPGYLNQASFNLIDLYGEGIPGFLSSSDTSTLYWKPKGGGIYESPEYPEQFPIEKDLRLEHHSLVSLLGDGRLDLVIGTAGRGGFYQCNADGTWELYQGFTSYPLDYVNPNKSMIDVDGDGIPDIMVFEGDGTRIYTSLKKEGYAAAFQTSLEKDFPDAADAYKEEVVTFSDFFGDGLSHRIRIRNGSIECWPHMGYGKFGKKVCIDHAPVYGDKLDASRLFLADTDGSGTTDIIYAKEDRLEVYLNQSGNSFSQPIIIPLPEVYSLLDQISFGDIYGNGASCLLFSKMTPEVKHYCYEFTGGSKPYLMTKINNNMGAVTCISYKSSTKYYLEDKAAGRPWITRLPFPVHVVEKRESIDCISGSKLTTIYSYHDGYYDDQEREFRGFGFVEVFDTEDFDVYNKPGLLKDMGFEKIHHDFFVAPVHTKRWYHTGAFFETSAVEENKIKQYYNCNKGKQIHAFKEYSFDDDFTSWDEETIRQAFRALKGQMLREEVYAVDNISGVSEHPYIVTETGFHVCQIYPDPIWSKNQEPVKNKYKAFYPFTRETISSHYERNPQDPRVEHQFILEIGSYGEVNKTCNVYYPRRVDGYPQQKELKTVATVSLFNEFELPGVPYDSRSYEISGLELQWDKPYFSYDFISEQVVNNALTNVIPHDGSFSEVGIQARLLNWTRNYYWDEAQEGCNVLGIITPEALLHHTETAVFTDDFIRKVSSNKNLPENKLSYDVMTNEGGYVLKEGYWWNCGLVSYYFKAVENRFCLPRMVENPIVPETSSVYNKAEMEYDPYMLSITTVNQYVNKGITQKTTALYDYTTLQPCMVKDANDNISQTVFDPLGMVIATSRYGALNGKNVGDMDLKYYKPFDDTPFEKVFQRLKEVAEENGITYTQQAAPFFYYQLFAQYIDKTFEGILESIENTSSQKPNTYLQQASSFFFYDQHAFIKNRQPARTISLIRETHASDLQDGKEGRIQVHIGFTDGFGREIEGKLKADPGQAFVFDSLTGSSAMLECDSRWVVSGRTVYNNKGKPVMKYQPYFSAISGYEDQKKVEALLPKPPVVHYDPLQREVRVDIPKGKLPPKGNFPGTDTLSFFSRVDFTPWEEKHYDQNDTIKDSEYFKAFQEFMRNNSKPTQQEIDELDALDKAAKFYNTPMIKVFDSMGNVFMDIADNLGEVMPDAFNDIVKKFGIGSQELWEQLISKEYLKIGDSSNGAWVTEKFKPYMSSYSLGLDERFKQLETGVINLLRQKFLVTYHEVDIHGRTVISIDPRLYYTNVLENTRYYNFKYTYQMDGKEPVLYDGADSGKQFHLNNIFEKLFWTWTARNFYQQIYYDGLQRKLRVQVQGYKDDGTKASDNTVEEFIYGESLENAKDRNLWGQLYKLKDQSGIITNSLFGIDGELLETSRQFACEYQKSINWSPDTLLEPEVYKTELSYDALKRIVSETMKREFTNLSKGTGRELMLEGSITSNAYNCMGLLASVSVCDQRGTREEIIRNITYDANGLRLSMTYGNGTETTYKYEDITKQLISLSSTRSGKDSDGGTRNRQLQDIVYTYDGVGNITRIRDNTFKTVFNDNQRINPLSDYTYDALYRLVKASGREHSGIGGNSYKSSRKTGHIKQSRFASLNDGNKLENYSERYSYDEAGNLIETAHAASNAWTRRVLIQPGSNRLQSISDKNGAFHGRQIDYDNSGNQKRLHAVSTADLTWNCCENLINTTIIHRPGEEEDCEYYTYDSNELRTRRISKHMTGNGCRIEEKIYLGNYEVKRIKTLSNTGEENIILERQTLRVSDDRACAAIIHFWKLDDCKKEVDMAGTRKLRYQMDNHLGSVSMELDKDACLISYEEYFPYGGTSIIAGDNKKEVELKEYRYSGKECDDSTGLYYYGARYYAPWLGRWLKPDPAGTVDGLNLYMFVGGNPVLHIDINGYMKRSSTDEITTVQNYQGVGGGTAQKKRKLKHGQNSTTHVGLEVNANLDPRSMGSLSNHEVVNSLGQQKPNQSMNYLAPPGSRVMNELRPPADILDSFKASPGPLATPISSQVTTISGIHGSNSKKSSQRLPLALPRTSAQSAYRYFIHARSGGSKKALAALVALTFALRDRHPDAPMYLSGDLNQSPGEVQAFIERLHFPRRNQLRVVTPPNDTHITRATGQTRTLDFAITNIQPENIKVTCDTASRRAGNPDHGRLKIRVSRNPQIIR